MKPKRDITRRAFESACKQHGFERRGVLGQYTTPSGLSLFKGHYASRREFLAALVAANERQNEVIKRVAKAIANPVRRKPDRGDL